MEPITTLNQRLIDYFGTDVISGKAIFRVVWADDMVEKRKMDTLDSGVGLLTPEVREVKKYSYLHDVHVLERLVIVPDEQQVELAGMKISYEPLWVFVDSTGNPLPPKWEPIKLIVDTLHAALGRGGLKKYVDPDTSEGAQEERITKLHDELFGNETEVGDALRYKEAVVVPNKEFK